MPTAILTDEQVQATLTMPAAIAVMEDAFRQKAAGALTHPARIPVPSPDGTLVFTAGAATGEPAVAGFRAYYKPARAASEVNDEQITVVYDSKNGALKGIVTGRTLGAMRTAAINGVAIRTLSRPDAAKLSLIGAGYHARFQVAAAMATRPIQEVLIAGRTPANAEQFAAEITAQYGVPARATISNEEAVAAADILICATNSPRPVLESGWLRPGTHINAIGPKLRDAHELPLDIVQVASVVATDSLAQVNGYGQPFFLPDTSAIIELDQIVTDRHEGRSAAEAITLFCSVGLAGTEVLLADLLLPAP